MIFPFFYLIFLSLICQTIKLFNFLVNKLINWLINKLINWLIYHVKPEVWFPLNSAHTYSTPELNTAGTNSFIINFFFLKLKKTVFVVNNISQGGFIAANFHNLHIRKKMTNFRILFNYCSWIKTIIYEQTLKDIWSKTSYVVLP